MWGGLSLKHEFAAQSFDFMSDNHLCLFSNPLPGRIGETNTHSFQGNKRKSQTGKVVMNNTALAQLMINFGARSILLLPNYHNLFA